MSGEVIAGSPPAAAGGASPWCHSPAKRAFDLLVAGLIIVPLLPLMGVLAVVVKLSSPGPALFRQARPGRRGREFQILKFRTMVDGRREQGPLLTRASDPRVTGIGRTMRRWKLDELPQLLNVLRGEMSLVGPRPQPVKLWHEPAIAELAQVILSVRPGLTSAATLDFRHEEKILDGLSAEEIEATYLRSIMPLKLRMDVQYLRRASFIADLGLLLRTSVRMFARDSGLQYRRLLNGKQPEG